MRQSNIVIFLFLLFLIVVSLIIGFPGISESLGNGNGKAKGLKNTTYAVNNKNRVPIAEAGEPQTIEATSTSGAMATLNASGSSDPDHDSLIYTWTGPFGSMTGINPQIQLPLGVHTITLTVNDGQLAASDTVLIIVVDTTKPKLILPSSITREASAIRTPVEIGQASATDIFPVTIINNAPVTYELGTTTVTWTAIDSNGNFSTATNSVTIVDLTKPVLIAPPDITKESGIMTPVEIGQATAIDIFPVTITTITPPGYKLGANFVVWKAKDANGNIRAALQKITIVDTKKPVLTVPPDITKEANGLRTPVEIGNATATDLNPVTIFNNAPAAFKLGTTMVTWTVVDISGNTCTGTQKITVIDRAPPLLNIPADRTVIASGETSPVSLPEATAVDLVDGPVAVTCNGAGHYPVGTTTITYTAIDRQGNKTTGTTKVTVLDSNYPVLIINGVTEGSTYTDQVSPEIRSIDSDYGLKIKEITLDGIPYKKGTAVNTLGQHILNVKAIDSSGNQITKTVRFKIFASTSLKVNVTPCAYSDQTQINAVLTSRGNPVIGQLLTFKINGREAGKAATNVDGKAVINSNITLSTGTYPVEVKMLQNDRTFLRAVTAAANLSITPEGANLTFTGSDMVRYPGTITLAAKVEDENDNFKGSLSLVKVKFNISQAKSNGTLTQVGSHTVTCNSSGIASIKKKYGVGVYTVKVSIVNGGYYLPVSATALVRVYTSSAGQTLGIGWIDVKNSKDGNPGKAIFNFNARYKGNNVTGNLDFDYNDGNIKFTTTRIDWLIINSADAQFQGVGTIKDRKESYTCRVSCSRKKQKGAQDKISIKIWNGTKTNTDDNLIYKALNMDVAGGEVVVKTK